MAEIRRTLIPQFTLRWILSLTAAMAVVSLIFARAMQGEAWADGIILSFVAFAITFAVYAFMFGVVLLVGRLLNGLSSRNRKGLDLQGNDFKISESSSSVQPLPPDVPSVPASKALLWAIIFTSLSLSAGRALAVSGTSVQTPQLQPGETNKTGLTLTLNTTWADASGYRPVKVSAKSIAGPVTADRVLTVTFRPMQGYTSNESVAVTQTLEIPAGGTSADITLAVPQLCAWGMFTLDVYEDGEFVKQLSVPENSAWTSWGGTAKGDGASPVVLLLSGIDKLTGNFLVNPSMELMSVAPENPAAVIDPQINSAVTGAQGAPSTFPSLSDLPTRWIDYNSIDVMLISLDKLDEYDSQQPSSAQLTAIRQWLHNGGTLIVYDAGPRWKNLAELKRLTNMNDALRSAESAESDPVKNGWILPDASLRGETLFNDTASMDAETANTTHKIPPANKAAFMSHACGLGMVVAIPSEELLPGMSKSTWNWVFNTIGPQRWQWSMRWGVSLYQNNDDFWNFLIPGVGLVPVAQFQVLITLFVIVLGPVNYYLLQRWGKLNLTVLTVPAGALVITAALLLYALIEDGLSVRARVRSFTNIDQRSGEATCWSRISYYAGLAPSGGLNFSENTAVVPLALQALANEQQPPRTVNWNRTDRSNSASPLEQQLTNGWLYSRTPTQYVTARIRHCVERLEIQTIAGGQPPRVVNHLGTQIKRLLLVDENGSCSTASGIASDATIALQSAGSQSSAYEQQLLPLLNEDLTGMSVIAPSGASDLFGFGKRQQYQNLHASGYSGPLPTYMQANNMPNGMSTTFGTGLLEQSFSKLREQLTNNALPARTYVAIVELSPECELGTTSAHQEKSLHVITGEW